MREHKDIEPSDNEHEDVTEFYYPPRFRNDDGYIHMACNRYSAETISSGAAAFGPSCSDYDLWLWIISRIPDDGGRPRISSSTLKAYRSEFEHERDLAASHDAFREHLLTLVPVRSEPTSRARFRRRMANSGDRAVVAIFEALSRIKAEYGRFVDRRKNGR